MPFRSQAQRRFMYAKHPDIAKRWEDAYGPGKGLPQHVKRKKVLKRFEAQHRRPR